MTSVAILGGGPAGLGAAYRLRKERKADEVILIERGEAVGGNAGSFSWNGHRLDYGSHRLHPSCDVRVMADIKDLLGDDLLDRPRHGRIRLLGRWVRFPLKPLDLVARLKPGFALGAAWDATSKPFRSGHRVETETFATVLQDGLGSTICNHFYFPYARKIWGRDPEDLSAIQARRRVSAGSFGKLLRRVLNQAPGLKKPGGGRFFYPRDGFGQISERYAEAAAAEGAEIRLGTSVTAVHRPPHPTAPWELHLTGPDGPSTVSVEHLWSTIPINALARMLSPALDPTVVGASSRIGYRGMILVYLELAVPQFTEFDAHYFPGEDVRITRLSEPKNYAVRDHPAGRTVLCAELPCDEGDEVWRQDDAVLGQWVADDLARAGLPLPGAPVAVTTRRLPQAYPVYLHGYEDPLKSLDEAVSALPRFLTFGRQGLFAHDNTHHALLMAYAACESLHQGRLDLARWRWWREIFTTHVVED